MAPQVTSPVHEAPSLTLEDRLQRVSSLLRLTHREGERHPINAWLDSFRTRAVVVALLLAALVALNEWHDIVPLLAGTPRLFARERYPLLFGAFFATFVALRVAAPAARRPILLVFSTLLAAYSGVAFAAFSAAYFVVLHHLVFARIPYWAKVASVFVSHLAGAAACMAFSATLRGIGCLFVLCFTLRIFYFLHEMKLRDFARAPFVDFLLYMMFGPFFIIVPSMRCVPRYGRFVRSLDFPLPSAEKAGVRYLLAGLLASVVFAAVRRALDPVATFEASVQAGRWGVAAVAAVLSDPVWRVLESLGGAYLLTGLVLLLGIDVDPPMDRPLASESILDWWRRWNTHFRSFLVDCFFQPVMLRFRKKHPTVRIVLACGAVFLVGSTTFHWLPQLFTGGTPFALGWGPIAENVGMFVLVSIALCRERDRRTRPAPTMLARLGRRVTTLALVSLTTFGLQYGVDAATHRASKLAVDARFAATKSALDRGDSPDARELDDQIDALRERVAESPNDARTHLALAYLLAATGPATVVEAKAEVARAQALVDAGDAGELRLLVATVAFRCEKQGAF